MNKGTRLGRRMADCTKEYTPTTSSEQEVYYGFFNVFTAARSRVLPLFLRFLRFFSTCRASSRTMASSARITQLHNKCACLSRIINAFGLMRSASAEEIPMFFFRLQQEDATSKVFRPKRQQLWNYYSKPFCDPAGVFMFWPFCNRNMNDLIPPTKTCLLRARLGTTWLRLVGIVNKQS